MRHIIQTKIPIMKTLFQLRSLDRYLKSREMAGFNLPVKASKEASGIPSIKHHSLLGGASREGIWYPAKHFQGFGG